MGFWASSLVICGVLVAGLLAGCAVGPEPVLLSDSGTTGRASGPIDGMLAFPVGSVGESWRFGVESGEHEGEVVVQRIDEVGSGEGFVVREELESGTVITERFVRLDGAGSLHMARMHNTTRGRVTSFDPAIVLLPAEFEPSEVEEQMVDLLVADLDAPGEIDQRGSGISTVTFRGVERIRTPMGEFDAYRVRSELATDFGSATSRRVTDRWYADGVGLVGESYEERISVFGIVVDTKSRSMRRIE